MGCPSTSVEKFATEFMRVVIQSEWRDRYSSIIRTKTTRRFKTVSDKKYVGRILSTPTVIANGSKILKTFSAKGKFDFP